MTKFYQEIARRLVAMGNCERSGNVEWLRRHRERIEDLCAIHLPHGSGLDGKKCTLDFDTSRENKLVFVPADFHHMDDNGMYDGWTEHTIIVRPDLGFGYSLTVTGRDRNGIKEYLHEVFSAAISAEIRQELAAA